MARLSLYLPPLAGDYSGVCSTLFGLNCLVIIVDANCCTRNYVEYDEPRWARRRKTAFSAQLRTLEAVMGDDARIIDQACEAVRELAPTCVAIIGSPVPAIMGMDLAGMATEVEGRTGVPSLGLPTTGFETYEHGVSLALDALVARFCGVGAALGAGSGMPSEFAAVGAPDAAADCETRMPMGCDGRGEASMPSSGTDAMPGAGARAACGCDDAGVPGADDASRLRVNVLGLSPHDFADEADMGCTRAWLAEAGVDVAFCPDGTYTLGDVAAAARANASLVVAWSGLAAARRLREEHGVPYVVGRPLCASDADELSRELRAVAAGDAATLRDEAGAALLAGGAVRALVDDDSRGVAAAQAEVGLTAGAKESAGEPSSLDAALSDAAPVLAGLLDELPAASGTPKPLFDEDVPAQADTEGHAHPSEPAPLLIVGEQVWANAVRNHLKRLLAGGVDASAADSGVAPSSSDAGAGGALETRPGLGTSDAGAARTAGSSADLAAPSASAAPVRSVVVASLFAMGDVLMGPGDVRLADEAALQDFARARPGLAWIGDPLLARIPELGAAPYLAVPHEALSSTLYERERAVFSGEGLLPALEGFIAELQG